MAACPSCGAPVTEGTKFCTSCGTTLPSAAAPQAAPSAAPPSAQAAPPAQPQPAYAYPPQYPAQAYPPAYPPGYGPAYGPPMGYPMARPRTALPTAGGALLIVAGVLGLIDWVMVAGLGGTIGFIPGVGDIGAIFLICGAIGIIFCVFALIGGIFAIQRKVWGLALTGSILGLFTIGPVLISSILSLVALILIAISREEFH